MTPGDHPLFHIENLYRAYRQCRRRKRGTVNALRFEVDCETQLLTLREALVNRTYQPATSVAFLVEKPKRREIFAADFRDRVVHHLLVGHLEPSWERHFIHDSYACRKGKGTHKAVDRLQRFLRKVTANFVRPSWYLQLDIRGFFVLLDRRILYERLIAHEPDQIVQWLIRVILFREPTENCRFRRTTRVEHERLPPHKTLFKSPTECGLPIGNLTSQFFANVYLDALDQFVKHTLKVRYYLRYCDDLVLLSSKRGELEQWERQIAQFLTQQLHLELNERRKLRPVADGIDFLGYIVRPDYLLVRRRVVGALRERLEHAERELRQHGMTRFSDGHWVFPWPWPLIERIYQWLNSYIAHFRKASYYHLMQSFRERFPWLDEYFLWEENKVTLRCPVPRHAVRYTQQRCWFKGHLPKHILAIQLGSWWDILGYGDISSQRVPARYLQEIQAQLWNRKVPVAWILETGRRISRIAERALVWRWDAKVKMDAASEAELTGMGFEECNTLVLQRNL